MPELRLPIALLLAAALAVPGAAAPKPQESWGKADVSFETYRTDAVECGRLAYYADVSDTEQAKLFVSASRRLEAADDHGMGVPSATSEMELQRMVGLAARSEQIRAGIRPEKRMKELHVGLVDVVETCLEQRGYSRFTLTEEQRDALGKLKKGSPERHRFMHSLASDADVLRAQKVASG